MARRLCVRFRVTSRALAECRRGHACAGVPPRNASLSCRLRARAGARRRSCPEDARIPDTRVSRPDTHLHLARDRAAPTPRPPDPALLDPQASGPRPREACLSPAPRRETPAISGRLRCLGWRARPSGSSGAPDRGGALEQKFSEAGFTTVITRQLMDQVRRRFPRLREEQVVLGPMGVDTNVWSPLGRTRHHGPFGIVNAARLHRAKVGAARRRPHGGDGHEAAHHRHQRRRGSFSRPGECREGDRSIDG